MPVHTFPFSRRFPDDFPRPLLPVRVSNPASSKPPINERALIDTGADCCFLPRDLTEALGHDFAKGVTPESVGTGSGTSQAYGHTSTIEICDSSGTVLWTIRSAPVYVIDGLDQVLLGVEDFLASFILTVDYSNQQFSLES
ncbi:MAG: hypothetical protein CO096_16800 [Armatimonadetes bacterium CG_4_9_14_3_um_filter_66_14]|nr:hypothetical protein [Armatimonadota bacterium]PIU93140.1 MAG: hypothetical protein COS65_14250 [Armatimonadetes bacterium CG06_land_8_20_14_3_00_66_21]PJB66738.1 MAG: hypothetical protein CO096_16800 [Armatimonadetes bacterium CG_4_9_14_3_um_filter_66_14]